MAGNDTPASVDRLRLGTGFAESERPKILELFRKLDRRLQRFPADEVDLELSVKERDTPAQSVVLECWIAELRGERFVATSTEPDLRDALMECREDLWRQIDRAISRRIDQQRR